MKTNPLFKRIVWTIFNVSLLKAHVKQQYLQKLWQSMAYPQSSSRDAILPSMLQYGLSPLSFLYHQIVNGRNILYDLHVRSRMSLPKPVISVGNLTVGGTGKTPFTEMLGRWALKHHYQPAILSRGYGSSEQSGSRTQANPEDDESLAPDLRQEIQRFTHSNRVEAGQTALIKENPDLFLLDDGFQHRQLFRDLNIVLVNGTCAFGNHHLLPAGPLREPLSALHRADIVVISHADQITNEQQKQLKHKINRFKDPETPILLGQHKLQTYYQYQSESFTALSESELTEFRDSSGIAFCGIGSPQSFLHTLEETALSLEQSFIYPDHYQFTGEDQKQMRKAADQLQTDYFVTTRKDVRRSTLSLNRPLIVPEITFDIFEGTHLLENRLRELLTHFSHPDA